MARRTVLRTRGISPKAVLAFCFPFVTTVAGVTSSWVVTGNFNGTELRLGVAGLIASSLAALGAYVGRPGTVVRVEERS